MDTKGIINLPFDGFIFKLADKFKLASVSVLSVPAGEEGFDGGFYSDPAALSAWPDFLRESARLRSDPAALFPWAKSVVAVACPFANIPFAAVKSRLEPVRDGRPSGRIAGYALLEDYHYFGKRLMASLVEELKGFIGEDFLSEICLDTAPVAERGLALLAGLGAPGANSCLLAPPFGSGCFLAFAFCGFEFPELRRPPLASPCSSCGACLSACPNGVIGPTPADFRVSLCSSYLAGMRRGVLSPDQRRLLRGNVFGCDLCTACCPGSNFPPSFDVDLEWLLCVGTSALEGMTKGTPMAHAGPALLKRNALAILGNYPSERSLGLVKAFLSSTNSDMLKQTCLDILHENNLRL